MMQCADRTGMPAVRDMHMICCNMQPNYCTFTHSAIRNLRMTTCDTSNGITLQSPKRCPTLRAVLRR
jgi:hypothetical protein